MDADRDHELLVRLGNRDMAAWSREVDRHREQTAAESWLSGRLRLLAKKSQSETR